MSLFKNNKHAFWQALVMALIIFWTGIILGVLFENSRINKIEEFYKQSETDILDIQLASDILNAYNFDCNFALYESISFADRIYEEAKTLEKYDASNKITEDMINLHKRYDLLRTILWRNTIMLQEKCPKKVNVVVYLYEYVNPSINTQAKQIALSKVLLDLKKKHGDKIILIPIAYDTNVKSLSLFREEFSLDKFPVIFINQKNKVTELTTIENLEPYLAL